MLIKTKGIVLRAIKYSETSIIADIYTAQKGLQSYIISGVRKPKAKLNAGLLQIMSLVDMVAYHRQEGGLHRIKEIRAAQLYREIPFNIAKGAIGMFMVELAHKTLKEPEENIPLFDFLFNAFLYLDQTPHSIAYFHLQFMVDLTAFLGFFPNGSFSEQTPVFDLKDGLFLDEAPLHLHFLEAPWSQYLSDLLQSNLQSCHGLSINRDDRKQILRELIVFYQLHIEAFSPMQSHEILEEVLGS